MGVLGEGVKELPQVGDVVVISAKRPETRAKRMDELIACCARGARLPQFSRPGAAG